MPFVWLFWIRRHSKSRSNSEVSVEKLENDEESVGRSTPIADEPRVSDAEVIGIQIDGTTSQGEFEIFKSFQRKTLTLFAS
jgi:hypothetical protein